MTRFARSEAAAGLRQELAELDCAVRCSVVEPGAYHTGSNQKLAASKYDWMHGRRCRILYAAEHFRCRICHGAKYESQYQHPAITASDRRWRIRKRLEERSGYKWPFALDDGLPPKPPRMHWRTYRKLEALDDYLDRLWCLNPSGEILIRR